MALRHRRWLWAAALPLLAAWALVATSAGPAARASAAGGSPPRVGVRPATPPGASAAVADHVPAPAPGPAHPAAVGTAAGAMAALPAQPDPPVAVGPAAAPSAAGAPARAQQTGTPTGPPRPDPPAAAGAEQGTTASRPGASAAAGTPVAPATVAFVDRADGYTLRVPAGWRFDGSLLPLVARWDGPSATLRVYMQPVSGSAGAADYVGYSNRSIDRGWNGIRLLAHWQRGGTWYRRWERPAMPLLSPDERQYAEWDTEVLGPGRVLTIMVNATAAGFPAAYAAGREAWRSARPVPTAGSNAFRVPRASARPAPLVPPAGTPLQWGVYEPALDEDHPSLAPVLARQKQLGHPLRVILTYRGLGRPFPTQLVRQAWAAGKIVELTLQSWSPGSEAGRALPYGHGTSAIGSILQGRDDAELTAFARAAAAAKVPFFFRWDNEMNGDWDPWSAFQWGKDTDLYVAAWRHVYRIFQRAGATNAVWIWNPNNDNLPAYRWNAAALYYPGGRYVDWVGLTGYNPGPGNTWRTFTQAYAGAYATDRALYPGKPLLITEFASTDAPGSKPAWIRAMFASLSRFPAIRYAVWWDADQGSLHYRLDQPPAALAAFRQGLRAAGAP